MAAYHRKYATATHIYLPLVKRGVVDFAVGADWTPVAGDVKVSIDGGAVANIGTLPTAIASGNTAFWDFTISTGETTGKKISIIIADAATKAIEDDMFSIETYGNASAEYQWDMSLANLPANVVQFLGTTLTETSGQIAAAFKKFFDKASPTGTINSLPDAVAGATNGLFIAGTNAATTVTTSLTTTFTGNLTGNVGGNVTGSIGSLATQAKTDVNNEVLDVINVDTYNEMGQEAPTVQPSLAYAIRWLYKIARNKITQNATTLNIYGNDETTVHHKATVTNTGVGGVYTRNEIGTGP